MGRSRSLMVAVCLLLSTAAARADGWYVGGFGSYAEADDVRFGTALGTVTTTFDSTTGFGLLFGREFGSLRLEAELGLGDFDVRDHILAGDALPGPTGKLETRTYLVNAAYDFNRDGRVNPYLGAGVGLADADLKGFGVAPVPDVLDDGDQAFAYQLLAGIGFRVGDDWTLFADYRYLVADGLSVTVSPAAGGVASDVDFESGNLTFGFRYGF